MSRLSPRKRMILPIHRKQEASVQRMYNFLQPGTYIRPHYHPRECASESICVLQGAIRFFVFDEEGSVIQNYRCEAGNMHANVIDIEPNVWHTFLVEQEDTLIFETKLGPYSETEDKIFASWSPMEGDEQVAVYMETLSKYKNEV